MNVLILQCDVRVFLCLSSHFRAVKMLRFSTSVFFSGRKVNLVGTFGLEVSKVIKVGKWES